MGKNPATTPLPLQLKPSLQASNREEATDSTGEQEPGSREPEQELGELSGGVCFCLERKRKFPQVRLGCHAFETTQSVVPLPGGQAPHFKPKPD